MSDKTRALLVEDNEGDHRLLKAALAEVNDLQIELCHVSRLSDAVNWLAREKFDVILLDLSLPDSQGLNTLTQGRQAAPGVPIVVLTGLDDEAMAIRALEIGAQDYLVKGKFDGSQSGPGHPPCLRAKRGAGRQIGDGAAQIDRLSGRQGRLRRHHGGVPHGRRARPANRQPHAAGGL